MDYLAHTPPKENLEWEAHRYADHIGEMLDYGLDLFDYLLSFSKLIDAEKDNLRQTFKAALMLHDLGKLDESIQRIFRGEDSGRLPVDHIEAGVTVADEMKNELLGWLIRGHHAPGLPSKKTEKYFIKQLRQKFQLTLSPYSLRGGRHHRDKLTADFDKHKAAIVTTNERIEVYKERQIKSCGQWPELSLELPSTSLTLRLMLSTLVDADHGSAACYSQGKPMTRFKPAETRWQHRLDALDSYIRAVVDSSSVPHSDRNQMRGEFYRRCFDGELHDSRLVACSASVGLGKTTSVMAYLLRCAIRDGASRLFVIAPFSNIIDQTVKVLRKAIVLEGEDAASVVVAHHHKAEFSNKDMRQYAASWQAPIVVTTSVQFFETLAASNPSKLRKLNNVVGAAIFIDESHACLPAELLNVSWYWMKQLADTWRCNVVFSSGSMVNFWNDKYLVSEEGIRTLPDLLSESLKAKTQQAEGQRVIFNRIENPFRRDDLVARIQSDATREEFINQDKPSCLVILNTVQSAAVIADTLARSLNDRENELSNKVVLHLSAALAPKDRDRMLSEVINRQGDSNWNHRPWYLVATSCVEAGVDLDFAIGFRETCSVTSFLQVSGRINRHGKRSFGRLFDFSIFADDGLNHHPGFNESSDIFNNLWPEMIGDEVDNSDLCSKAIRKELSRFQEKKTKSELLLSEEQKQGFQEVSSAYRIIDSETATVIVDASLVEKLELGIPVNWQAVQENSVQLWVNKIEKLKLQEIRGCQQDGIYSWIDTYEYDGNFLGIMGGILRPETFFKETGGVI